MKFTAENSEKKSALPDGKYNLEIVEAQEKIGKTSGNPYIKLTLIATLPDDSERKIFDNIAAAWKATQLVKAIGLTANEGEEIELNESVLIGKKIQAQLKTNKDGYNEVNYYIEFFGKPDPKMAEKPF